MAYRPVNRVHVGPQDLGNGAATDYWWNFTGTTGQTAAASATNNAGLSGWLHTTTSLVQTAGTAGDFNSSSDFTPSHILTDAGSDAFVTPRIFGGYDQFQRVSDVLGYAATELVVDQYAAFTVTTNDEVGSFFGLVAPAVTDSSAAGSGGAIRCNGVNFVLTSDNGADTGLAVDTAWRKWRIVYGSTNTEWFTGATHTSQGTITTENDIWPLSYKLIVVAAGTNRIGLSWLHLFYR